MRYTPNAEFHDSDQSLCLCLCLAMLWPSERIPYAMLCILHPKEGTRTQALSGSRQEARSRQELSEPLKAIRSYQGPPGAARSRRELSGAVRSQPGAARSRHGAARSRRELSGWEH